MSSSWGARNVIKDLTCIGEINFTKKLLNEYLSHVDMREIKSAVRSHGYYLANAESTEHQNIAFEVLKNKLKVISCGKAEKRKNSWINSFNFNLLHGNNKAVASLIASFWRRTLSETSLKKAERSLYGYILNGGKCSKIEKEKEITALCEWCNAEITVSMIKGFTCPCCGVFFQNYDPSKMKIKRTYDEFYYEPLLYEEQSICDKVRQGALSLYATRCKHVVQPSLF